MSGETDPELVAELRTMARDGRMPSEMFAAIKGGLGTTCHILDIIRHFREAFSLSLAEAKPLACEAEYSAGKGFEIGDAPLLDSLILPAINTHAAEWSVIAPATRQAEPDVAQLLTITSG